MNIHLPCDEIGRRILQQLADCLAPSGTVADLVNAYRALPEMTASSEGVELVCGSPAAQLGTTVVVHAAGTNGGYPVANALFEGGIGTVVYIHLSDRQRIRLMEENKGNLILTGHYASDSLGINPLIDALEDAGVKVDCCNKMIRVKSSANFAIHRSADTAGAR
jgi:imidazolonepropionase-like amidohydrolase